MKENRIVIIDGNSLINRAFYALPPLTNREGSHTNALYGFLTMLAKIFEEYDPQYMGVAFDLKAPTFRHKEFTEYKLGRKKMPPELAEQIEPLKELLDALNIHRVEAEGFEADDLIGTLAKYCQDKGMESLIVTGDKDALQLASDKTKILLTKKGISSLVIYDDKKVMEEYQVTPLQFIDVKGLMGDASDNIPGVPGVGEKTAIKLINEFTSVENLINNTDKISSEKLREKIENHIQEIILSKRLATIVTNVPVEIELQELLRDKIDNNRLLQLFRKYEFNSLISRFIVNTEEYSSSEEVKTIVINNLEQLKEAMEEIRVTSHMAIKSFGVGKNKIEEKIIALAMITASSKVFFIDFRHFKQSEEAWKIIKLLLENPDIGIFSHDVKEEIIRFKAYNITINSIVFDTMLAAYLIDASKSSYGLKELAALYLNIGILSVEELIGKGKKALDKLDIPTEELSKLLTQQVDVIDKLTPIMKEKMIHLNMEELYYDIELPLAEVLASMELVGIKVDKNMLQNLEIEFSSRIHQLTKEIYHLAQMDFNINSPKQLGEVLFEKLHLPPIKKTKTGYSTNAEVLEKLRDKHEIIDKILEYRQVMKLKSTYVEGLLAIINPVTGRIHSNFNQTVTTTGRISSTEPNLQNIPVKMEMGRQLRKVFVAEEGYKLVDADYSQIELRVLAHISQDENLLDAFEKCQDIHTRTAAEIFNVDMQEVTSIMRSSAKAVNFGIVYGISDFGLGENLNISRAKAKKYIDSYLEKYHGVREYMQSTVQEGKKKGYIVTLLNRRRYLPEINSSNFNVRSFGERVAMNTPIQGTAADIIKIAMVKVYNKLKEEGLKGKLILQVHDELIVEAPENEVDKIKILIRECMEGAMKLRAHLKVDLSTGSTWYEAK